MGPQHPATHGVLRVILRLDGEKVLGLECVIGYLHRGVEKIGEHRTYTMFNPYVDRMDYVAAVSNGLGYCEAVEKLLNVEAPPRAQYIRVILTELNRMASHQLWLGTHALDIGAITPLFYTFRDREEILKIFEKYCGATDDSCFSYRRTAIRNLRRLRKRSKNVRQLREAEDRRVRRTADNQPHLAGAYQGRGRDFGQGRHCAGRDRTGSPRQRREVGHSQGNALRQL
jgi:NADH:ubiquinone oxidoreductase subunit D